MKWKASVGLTCSLWLLGWAGAPIGRAATEDVDIINFSFSPRNVTVRVGDTVRWTQRDNFAQHTTTSGVSPTPDGVWDSGLLGLNQTFSFTFNTPGTYPYFCIPHAFSMTGTVIVEAAPNEPPVVTLGNPTNGASFTAPALVTIQAAVADDHGVTQVEFFDGATSLGIDLLSPYEVTVPLAVGGHTLTARATDDEGLTGTSAPVSVTVRTVPILDPIPERVAKGDITIELETVVDGLASPMGMAVPDDGSGRMFVYDQSGVIWVVSQGAKLATPLLDIRTRLVTLGAYDERGLLGLAAHPNFAEHPLLYTYTSEPVSGPADFTVPLPAGVSLNHQSVIAEWRIAAASPNQVDPVTRRELLRIDQPQSNHNGGAMHFGPDGLLYIALGDGGAADDQGSGHSPGGNGQDPSNVLGAFLRIDVDGTSSANGRYGVPAENPFVGQAGVDEIFAYGFRNPFSFSFDRETGELYVGDVGQNKIEEVDIVLKGRNHGWNVKEGTFYFDPNGDSAGYVTGTPAREVPPDLVDPIAQYDHDEGLAIVGGYVYRGSQIPALVGRYVTADWGNFNTPSGRLFYLDAGRNVREFRLGLEDRPLGHWVKGFGQDASGELYVFVSRVLGPVGNTGRMLKIVPSPAPVQITQIAGLDSQFAATVWEGGQGPFALQKKVTLADPTWVNQSFTTQRTSLLPLAEKAGFFRLADTAHQPAIPLTLHMSGLLERPDPLVNTAAGSGTFSLEDNTLTFDIEYRGLSGPATAAHIHGPASAAQSTGVLINLAPFNGGAFGTSGSLSGTVVLTPQQKAIILAGQAYVNVHTAANQAGEMRGQIAPVLMQVSLNGANERPNPTSTSGAGLGSFMLAGRTLTFNLTYRGLTAPATAAHIHGPASAEGSTNVLVDLAPFNGGAWGTAGTLAGSVTLTEQQLAYVIDGLTYVNIHTPTYTGGEIRGQILPQSTAVPFTALLSGLLERPTPLTNTATGSGTFSLEGNLLTLNIRYAGLSGDATAAHIHGPASAATSAGILVNLAPYNGGAFGSSGSLSGTVVLTPAQKAWVLSGQTYVNVHTAANSAGEMRGQIAPVLMRTSLGGANERPSPVATAGSGTGVLTLVGDQLRMNVTYRNLSGVASASHIHGPATVFQSATVLINLAPYNGGAYGAAGSLFGTASLIPDHLTQIIDGLTYVNFHTAANSGGEIRGQITR